MFSALFLRVRFLFLMYAAANSGNTSNQSTLDCPSSRTELIRLVLLAVHERP